MNRCRSKVENIWSHLAHCTAIVNVSNNIDTFITLIVPSLATFVMNLRIIIKISNMTVADFTQYTLVTTTVSCKSKHLRCEPVSIKSEDS